MKNLLKKLPGLPRRLSCFGEGESEINQATEDSNTPAYSYDENEWARQQAEFQSILNSPVVATPQSAAIAAQQPAATVTQQPTYEMYNYGYQPAAEAAPITVTSGEESEYQSAYSSGVKLSPNDQSIAATYGITAPAPVPSPVIQSVAPNAPQVAVQPSTTTQVFNLVDTIAKGLLAVQETQAKSKLSVAQINAAAEQSKVQAQNYVQSQLQAGKSVLVPQEWLAAYSQSGTWTKWLTPILVVGGMGLLAFAVYKYTQKKKSVAANPRRHGKRRR